MWCRHHSVDVAMWLLFSTLTFATLWLLTSSMWLFSFGAFTLEATYLLLWCRVERDVPAAMQTYLRQHAPLSTPHESLPTLMGEEQYSSVVEMVDSFGDSSKTEYQTVIETQVMLTLDFVLRACIALLLIGLQLILRGYRLLLRIWPFLSFVPLILALFIVLPVSDIHQHVLPFFHSVRHPTSGMLLRVSRLLHHSTGLGIGDS